jgi:hypothetical protein
MTKEWFENRLKQLEYQLFLAELKKAAVDGAIQECQHQLEQLKTLLPIT